MNFSTELLDCLRERIRRHDTIDHMSHRGLHTGFAELSLDLAPAPNHERRESLVKMLGSCGPAFARIVDGDHGCKSLPRKSLKGISLEQMPVHDVGPPRYELL